jgi:hypothetical protein
MNQWRGVGGMMAKKRDASIKETSPLSLTKLPVNKFASEKVNGGHEGPPLCLII